MKQSHQIRDLLQGIAGLVVLEIYHLKSEFSWHNLVAVAVVLGAVYGVGKAYDQLVEGHRVFAAYLNSQYKDACDEWFDLECDLYHSENLLFEKNSKFPKPKYPEKPAKWISHENPYNLEFRQRLGLIKQMTEQVDERITQHALSAGTER